MPARKAHTKRIKYGSGRNKSGSKTIRVKSTTIKLTKKSK